MLKINRSYLTMSAFILAGVALFFFQELANAAGTKDLSAISEGLKDQVKAVSELLIVIAYVAGVGFALAGVIQFKAHKDNPTQVPLSKPIVYLVVSACLLFLPTIIKSTGETIFGGDQEAGAEGTIDF